MANPYMNMYQPNSDPSVSALTDAVWDPLKETYDQWRRRTAEIQKRMEGTGPNTTGINSHPGIDAAPESLPPRMDLMGVSHAPMIDQKGLAMTGPAPELGPITPLPKPKTSTASTSLVTGDATQMSDPTGQNSTQGTATANPLIDAPPADSPWYQTDAGKLALMQGGLALLASNSRRSRPRGEGPMQGLSDAFATGVKTYQGAKKIESDKAKNTAEISHLGSEVTRNVAEAGKANFDTSLLHHQYEMEKTTAAHPPGAAKEASARTALYREQADITRDQRMHEQITKEAEGKGTISQTTIDPTTGNPTTVKSLTPAAQEHFNKRWSEYQKMQYGIDAPPVQVDQKDPKVLASKGYQEWVKKGKPGTFVVNGISY